MPQRPLGVSVLSALAVMNGLGALALGVVTLGGSQVLYQVSGIGPNRVAMAFLLGPLSPYAGWVAVTLALLFFGLAYALFGLRTWALHTVLAILGLSTIGLLAALGWALAHQEWGTAVAALPKIALVVGLGVYLASPRVQQAFAVSQR